MLKRLADENIAGEIIAWLRAQGCDVLSASDRLSEEVDAVLLRTAEAEGRLLLTEDKDFGELVFRDRLNSHGVLLLRMGMRTMQNRGAPMGVDAPR